MLLSTFVQDPLFSKRIMFHRRRTLTFNILCCLVLNSQHLRTSPQQPEIQECGLWQENICGVRCMSLWSMINCHTTPIFVDNSHERPFSIIPKANTYGFLTKKWSPPEIQECDLWQGNLCGVRCTSLQSMINGDTTPIFVENSHE